MNEVMFKQKLDSCRKILELQVTCMTNILERRLVFERVHSIIQSNQKLHTDNLFWDWYFYNYVDSQVMEISKIFDHGSSSNLPKLVNSLLSGEKLDPIFFNRLNSQITSLSTLPCFDISELNKDLGELQQRMSIRSIKGYRDCKTAHNDPQKRSKLDLDLKKMNDSIDWLHVKILDYELRLNGTGYPDSGLLPEIAYDWEEIFEVPWKPRDRFTP